MLTAATVSKGAIGFGVVQGGVSRYRCWYSPSISSDTGKLSPISFFQKRKVDTLRLELDVLWKWSRRHWHAAASLHLHGGSRSAARRAGGRSPSEKATRRQPAGKCGMRREPPGLAYAAHIQAHIQAHSRVHDAGKRGGVGCGMRLQPKQLEPRP